MANQAEVLLNALSRYSLIETDPVRPDQFTIRDNHAPINASCLGGLVEASDDWLAIRLRWAELVLKAMAEADNARHP